MAMERLDEARLLLSADEKMSTITIKRKYKQTLKKYEKDGELNDQTEAQLKSLLKILLIQRRQVKTEEKLQLDNNLNMQIRQKITAKKFFAPKLWLRIVLPIIFWSIFQEIIMASTDIVDNIFVNKMTHHQISDDMSSALDKLNEFIKTHWHYFTKEQIINAGIDSSNYQMDEFNVGQIAVNGVTASNQLYTIMFCIVSGSCYGIGVYSAQYYGAGNYERLRNITALKFYFTITVTTLFALIALPGITPWMIKFTTNPGSTPQDLSSLNTSSDNVAESYRYIQYTVATLATKQGVTYFRTICLSYILLAINESIITSLRETRRPVYSFIMSVVALIVNCILNVFLTAPVFLGDFHGLGIEGTALATAIARLFQTIVIFVFIFIKRFEFFPRWKSFKMEKEIWSRPLLKASPIIINETLYAFGQVLIVKFKGMYSVDVLTANAIFSSMVAALFSPLYHGMNAGISVMVGNNLGANNFDLADYNAKQLVRLSLVIGVVFGGIMIGLSFVVPSLLYSEASSSAQTTATMMVAIFAAVYPIYMITNSCYSMLRVGGSMWGAFLMDSGMVWGIQIPLLATLVLLYTNKIILISYVYIHLITMLFYLIQFVVSYAIYRRKKWLRNVTVEKVIVETPTLEKISE